MSNYYKIIAVEKAENSKNIISHLHKDHQYFADV